MTDSLYEESNAQRRDVMKKVAILGAFAILALALVGPAQAKKVPYEPSGPSGKSCTPRSVGYNATGTLVSSSLTPDGNGRYSGTIEVDVTRANHKAPTGTQTYTLVAARVKFHKGVDAEAPAAGSRVKVHGKITKLGKRCPTEGFTPAITVRKVDVRQAKQKKA
jgi:hypothetical protein